MYDFWSISGQNPSGVLLIQIEPKNKNSEFENRDVIFFTY